ncbi:YybH family protein [Thioalkalivibrio sulfidiphilus]|uniref:YybH family protein n=1 Tax=Thioalkalivibrio sulfidiphilus TaxID=1033854 RepID=UPI000368B939|nr:nuclear transport factor 2 family protein [Thioalkalivibrio sulfidiphilus]
MPQRYATPDEAEAAYYAAFQAADLDAMMDVWLEHPDIVCMHPVGGHLLRGYPAVLEGWLHVFARELDIKLELKHVVRTVTADLAVHSGEEHITRSGDTGVSGIIRVTNVYQRTLDGWRMVQHHASPGPREPHVEAPPDFLAGGGGNRTH